MLLLYSALEVFALAQEKCLHITGLYRTDGRPLARVLFLYPSMPSMLRGIPSLLMHGKAASGRFKEYQGCYNC
jgi:hypothetical protein